MDRIVADYPRGEMAALRAQTDYKDVFLNTAEHFYLFVVQESTSPTTELCLDKLPLSVCVVNDIKPYKERKMVILNGVHAALVPVAFLVGIDTMDEVMNDTGIYAFTGKVIRDEIIPALDLSRDGLESFASAITERSHNPYIKHQLLSIMLSGVTKYHTHILPRLLVEQQKGGQLPPRLTFVPVALITFYQGERKSRCYPIQDDTEWLMRCQTLWTRHRDRQMNTRGLITTVFSVEAHWE